MRTTFAVMAAAGLAVAFSVPAAHADDRTLVEMPAPMQEHMLGNMRDHLRALDEILAALAEGDTITAASVAEQRLGLSSLDDHGAAHLAGYMPPGMQAAGTEMHTAASRFIQAAQNADVENTVAAEREVYGALQGITAACNACHAGFRIR